MASASLGLAFNNALIENYTNDYAKMGFHSDQALDLEDNSHIALFSCYKDPNLAGLPRMLVIEPKDAPGETIAIPLPHLSVVIFSLGANMRYRHKITLDRSANPPENQWLGITFRTSKTFVQFQNNQPILNNGAPLTLADETEAREFYTLRRRENKELDFSYHQINYTISASDMMVPDQLKKQIGC